MYTCVFGGLVVQPDLQQQSEKYQSTAFLGRQRMGYLLLRYVETLIKAFNVQW